MTKRSGPLYTLLAGFVLAAAMLSLNVTTGSGVTSYSGGTAPATPGTAPTPTPTAAGPSATAPPDADYAGRTADRAAVSGGTINCPCHGSKYRVADASVAAGPAPRPLAPQPITVRSGEILLP
jgi:hypothetical protein